MSIPSTINTQIVISKLDKEINPISIILKGTNWTIFSRYGILYIKEFNGTIPHYKLLQSVEFYSISNALTNLGDISTDKFILWTVENSNLYATEIEPFIDQPPILGTKFLIKENVSAVKSYTKPGTISTLTINRGDFGVGLILEAYSSLGGSTTLNVALDWDEQRIDSTYSIFYKESDRILDITYTKPGSPPNVYLEEYSLVDDYTIPTGEIIGISVLDSIIVVENAPITEFIISVPDSGAVGSVISIYTTSEFDPIESNNIIFFGDVVASQFTLINSSRLDVVVPIGAESGDVYVKTSSKISNSEFFIVIYEEIFFDRKVKNPGRFFVGATGRAIYNRDISITDFSEITDENSMIQNLYNIILTRPGERLFNPDFGCGIHDLVFKLMEGDDISRSALLDSIEQSLEIYEPRISLNKQNSTVSINNDTNSIEINLHVIVPSGNVRVVSLSFGSK